MKVFMIPTLLCVSCVPIGNDVNTYLGDNVTSSDQTAAQAVDGDDESISIPANITGSYLFCRALPAPEQEIEHEVLVGCGISDSDKNKITEPVKWTYQNTEITQQIDIDDKDSIWNVIFSIKDSLDNISVAKVTASLETFGFQLSGTVEALTEKPLAKNEVAFKEVINFSNAPQISEFVFNHTGIDRFEFIEVSALPNTSLADLTLLVIEGDAGNPMLGQAKNIFPLTETNEQGYWVTDIQNNALENGSQTILLVRDYDTTSGGVIDTDGDGVIDVTPWTEIVDSLAVSDGGSNDLFYSPLVFSPGEPSSPLFSEWANKYVLAGASKIANSSNLKANWIRNDFYLAGHPDYVFDPTRPPVTRDAMNTPGTNNKIIK